MRSILLLAVAAILVAGCSTGPKSGEVRVNPKDGAEMVWVPAGKFIMGSTDDEMDRMLSKNPEIGGTLSYVDQTPHRRVFLSGYWMYKYPVTVAQYRQFCKDSGHSMPNVTGVDWKDDGPIIYVMWDDAVQYAKWAGARLPTEAEWEKAARGTDGRLYPWGDEWDASKCAKQSGGNDSNMPPLGSHQSGASPYGCMDMAGYVLEWCADWYDPHYYADAPARNPKGPSDMVQVEDEKLSIVYTGARVLRGAEIGDWDDGSIRYLCADRYYTAPNCQSNRFGFRCVVSEDQ